MRKRIPVNIDPPQNIHRQKDVEKWLQEIKVASKKQTKSKIPSIPSIPSNINHHEDIDYTHAANIINTQKIPIAKLQELEEWKNLDLVALAPHLRYVDMRGLDTNSIQLMLGSLTNVNSLFINDPKITELPPLPNCETLDCNYCSSLSALPELPNCRTLSCYGCYTLNSLPELPNCLTLNCGSCHNLTTFPELPNCLTLECFDCANLLRLPDLPNCLTLACSDCPGLLVLPELPNCQKLYCSSTPLVALPKLPNCQSLDCSSTPLASLPELPNCTWLKSRSCKELTALPELPLCRILDCSFCPVLTALHDLPNCQNLNCRSCKELAALPELPNCQKLDCRSCRELAALPELPLCRILDCSECLSLNRFPTGLPACEALTCRDCPIADRLPELPANARVISESDDVFTKMTIDIEDLEKNPKKYLDDLGSFLLKRKGFPNIHYTKDGELSDGIDVGGLRRDFVSRTFRSVFTENGDEGHLMSRNLGSKEGLEPIARQEDEVSYRTLGQLMARCYLEESFFTTGSVFRTSFFQSILDLQKSTSDDALAKILLDFEMGGVMSKSITADLDPEKNPEAAEAAYVLIDLYDEEYMETKFGKDRESKTLTSEQYKELIWPKIIEKAKSNGYVQATLWIADEMKNKLGVADWNALGEMKAVNLQEKIQGRLSAKLLKEKMRYYKSSDLTSDIELENVKTFFETWIDAHKDNLDKLSLFVEGVTSNSTLGAKGIKIEVYDRGPQYIPNAHTCFFSLDVSSKYENQDAFNKALQTFLDNFKEGTGFQFV